MAIRLTLANGIKDAGVPAAEHIEARSWLHSLAVSTCAGRGAASRLAGAETAQVESESALIRSRPLAWRGAVAR